MATLARLESALRQADAVGNIADARLLAAEIRKIRTAEIPETPHAAWTGPVDADQGTDSLLDKAKNWIAGTPPVRGSVVGRAAMGMADPGVAAVQMGANLIGADGINKGIQEAEQKYQTAREGYGSTGFDPLRMAGNIAMTAPMAGASPQGATLLQQILRGGRLGAGFGSLQPVTDGGDDFWKDKAIQTGTGYALGAASAPLAAGLGRMASPKGNADVAALEAVGVQPTIGQRLGGFFDIAEQKAQSIPILGDAITAARGRAREQFNTAAINEALDPIKAKVSGSGFDAVNSAHSAVSDAYTDAAKLVKGVMFDNQSAGELSALRSAAKNLMPDEAARFESILTKEVMPRVSPAGGMTTETFKILDSRLGELAGKYKDRELGDSILELNRILKEAARRQSPDYAKALDAADSAFARMVRIEAAAKGAKGSEGIFTPGQLMSGVMQSDRSARKSAVGRGTALMQGLANRGQKVLGNKYPDSGTAGRMALGLGTVAAGAMNPAIPLGLAGGAALYLPQSQHLAAALLNRRPVMEPFAQALRQYAPVAGVNAAPFVIGGQ